MKKTISLDCLSNGKFNPNEILTPFSHLFWYYVWVGQKYKILLKEVFFFSSSLFFDANTVIQQRHSISPAGFVFFDSTEILNFSAKSISPLIRYSVLIPLSIVQLLRRETAMFNLLRSTLLQNDSSLSASVHTNTALN